MTWIVTFGSDAASRIFSSWLYGSACTMFGVLSVAYGLSVWCDGHQLWWHRDGQRTTWPASDPDGAARYLVDLAHDQDITECSDP
jgi:hypothetical protein